MLIMIGSRYMISRPIVASQDHISRRARAGPTREQWMRTHGGRPAAPRPVIMMTSGDLADEVSRLAAAAGCDLHRISDLRSDPGSVREQWSCAPLLLLDLAAARDCASAGLPRRDGVVIVCPDADPHTWRCAVAVGA